MNSLFMCCNKRFKSKVDAIKEETRGHKEHESSVKTVKEMNQSDGIIDQTTKDCKELIKDAVESRPSSVCYDGWTDNLSNKNHIIRMDSTLSPVTVLKDNSNSQIFNTVTVETNLHEQNKPNRCDTNEVQKQDRFENDYNLKNSANVLEENTPLKSNQLKPDSIEYNLKPVCENEIYDNTNLSCSTENTKSMSDQCINKQATGLNGYTKISHQNACESTNEVSKQSDGESNSCGKESCNSGVSGNQNQSNDCCKTNPSNVTNTQTNRDSTPRESAKNEQQFSSPVTEYTTVELCETFRTDDFETPQIKVHALGNSAQANKIVNQHDKRLDANLKIKESDQNIYTKVQEIQQNLHQNMENSLKKNERSRSVTSIMAADLVKTILDKIIHESEDLKSDNLDMFKKNSGSTVTD